MNIDISTMTMVLSIVGLLQFIAIFIQWQMNEVYPGPGWWVLGAAARVLAYVFLYLRVFPKLASIAIVANNILFLLSQTFIYIGILRFFDRRERRGALISFLIAYAAVDIYLTYFYNSLALRLLVLSLALAFMLFATARATFLYQMPSIRASARLVVAVCATAGIIFVVGALLSISLPPGTDILDASPPQLLTSLAALVGSMLSTFGFILLINHRLSAENREARENRERIFNTGPDAVSITRLSDGCFVDINDGFVALSGYSRSEVIGQSSLSLNLWAEPGDREKVEKQLKESGYCQDQEFVFRHRDGSRMTGLFFAKVISLQGIPYIYSVTRDISELKQALESLGMINRRYERAVRGTTDGIWDVNLKTGEIYHSPRYMELLGYLPDDFPVAQAGFIEQVHPDDRSRVEVAQKAHLEQRGPYNVELRMRTRQGDYKWFNSRGQAEWDENGNPLSLAGSITDITERKKAEEKLRAAYAELEQRVLERTTDLRAANAALEKAARAKDDFLAIMSHELRTPLTGILGLSQVLQLNTYGELTEKQLHAAENIEKSGQHLLELINEILDYSRIQSGKLEVELAFCSLAEICADCLQTVNQPAAQKKQELVFGIKPENINLRADTRRLRQVLNNLLSNAVKFTPDGGRIELQACGNSQAGQVRISVIDNGIGIKEEDMPGLFLPFQQLDTRLARMYNGTGMGLTLVKSLVELHGGRVEVQSVFGQGSRFTVILPWAE